MRPLPLDAAVAPIAQVLEAARGRVLVLTGAGLSTASGLPDFRSAATGMWERFDPERLARIDSLEDRPGEVWDFYAWRVGMLDGVEPNAAHHAIHDLVHHGVAHAVVTQNVDGLHAAAGTEAIEVHGSLRDACCLRCGLRVPMAEALAARGPGEPSRCSACGGVRKPGVVMFGEMLDTGPWDAAVEAAAAAHAVLAIGTSLAVAPASTLPELVHGPLVLCTRERVDAAPVPDLWSDAPVEELVPAVVRAVLG